MITINPNSNVHEKKFLIAQWIEYIGKYQNRVDGVVILLKLISPILSFVCFNKVRGNKIEKLKTETQSWITHQRKIAIITWMLNKINCYLAKENNNPLLDNDHVSTHKIRTQLTWKGMSSDFESKLDIHYPKHYKAITISNRGDGEGKRIPTKTGGASSSPSSFQNLTLRKNISVLPLGTSPRSVFTTRE